MRQVPGPEATGGTTYVGGVRVDDFAFFSVNRWLTWFHRWAGVVLCLLFAVWFASGAVLHFVGFPSLSDRERHSMSAIVDPRRIAVSPAAALAVIPGARDLRLVNRGGHPAYLAQTGMGYWSPVSGESGRPLSDLSPPEAQAIAEQFGHAKAVQRAGPMDYDQWIVHQHFDPFRPFYRIRLDDGRQTDLYVSARTGEVLQRTRFAERAWNWMGAIVHWIYFTPLRRSWSAWNQVVWWVSLAALLSSAAGAWLGTIRMIANRAAGRRGLSPFRGWMRWHHLIGLFASVIVLSWMMSGWLSMDHGRVFSTGHATESQVARLSGIPVTNTIKAATLQLLQTVGSATEIAFNAIAGRSLVTSYQPGTGAARIFFVDDAPASLPSIPESVLLAGIRDVWPAARVLDSAARYDGLYRQAESAGDDAAGFSGGDGQPVRAYVDIYSGRFVAVMDPSRRSYAWLYYGVHTLEFPGLIEHPALRTALVLSLLTLGFASSATGVVLSIKRLRRDFG